MTWRKPTLEEEREELLRAAQDLDLDPDAVLDAMDRGRLATLDGFTWCSLENTDSNDTFSIAEVEEVAWRRYKKDVAVLCRQITSNQVLPAPIVFDRPKRRSWLVSGNVRLMICRALNMQPKVWRIAV